MTTNSGGLSPVDLAARLIGDAGDQRYAGMPDVLRRCMARLVAHGCDQPRVLDEAVGWLLGVRVRMLATCGWLPVDMVEISRRRLDRHAASYLADAVATECARHAPATLDDRWTGQLRELDATVWWGRGSTHLPSWCARHGRTLTDAVAVVIELLALCRSLPKLPVIAAPPGQAVVGTRPPAGVDEKILGRVRGLLAKAESTEFDEEAEALSAKAQQLMSRYALSRAMVEYERGAATATTTHRMWLENPYLTAKASLVGVVASANRCRTVVTASLGFAEIVGDPVDVEATVLLATSLLVQATRAMVTAGRHVTRTGQSRTRSFRQSFLVAYAGRIGERLAAAAEQVTEEVVTGTELLPVLASRREAIDAAVAEHYPRLRPLDISVSNRDGWGAGRAAADAAHLGLERPSLT
ncbi:DUF2786 domain-containing protein [Fodinicola acaciae]|uniref:DUF2786 domain-containing protein n=1 Tax=Fodinicola acaciae TaxID=2681555 RepID=UPI0013D768A5|nr:DUF2786 domain-containing protein [Fodinicola acaciae]